MKPAAFEYARPESLDEAVEVLAEHGDDAKVLAGGQSLVPLLNMRFARPGVLVDVNRVPGLDGIDDGDEVRVGALVRQGVFEASTLVADRLPLAARGIRFVGHFVTRNRGTIGGSIAHADARAELSLVLVALGGSASVASVRGTRVIPAETLFVSHFTTSLEPDELLVETSWPAARPGQGFAFEERAQRHGDFALGMAACSLSVEAGTVKDARVAVGAVAEVPLLVEEAAALLVGRPVDDESAQAAGRAVAEAIDPQSDLHATAAYRRNLASHLTALAVARAYEDATR